LDIKVYKCKGFDLDSTVIERRVCMRSTIVANVIMLGAFASATTLMAAETMKKAILSSVPEGTERLNLASFDEGYEYGKRLLGKREIR